MDDNEDRMCCLDCVIFVTAGICSAFCIVVFVAEVDAETDVNADVAVAFAIDNDGVLVDGFFVANIVVVLAVLLLVLVHIMCCKQHVKMVINMQHRVI